MVVKHWHRLLGEVVNALSLEIFKAGQGSEQPDAVEDIPACCRVVGLDGL